MSFLRKEIRQSDLFILASAYYTPEQLSGYYDQLISAGYMTKEQAKEALDQVR